jgi:hypothetical protein
MTSFRKAGFVSLWVCREKHDSSKAGDPLRDKFGIDYYDLDSLESIIGPDWASEPVNDMISRLSYSKSFAEEAIKAATARGIENSRGVIALYDVSYSPPKTAAQLPDEPIFLGAFRWNEEG